MILNKENEILDDPAYKDFINKFIDRNKNKLIYLLRYSKEESELINNLKQAKKEKVDIILSEILPNELPNCILIDEYNFFIKRYVFLEAKYEKLNKTSELDIAIIKDTNLLTAESKLLNIFSDITETALNCKVIELTDNETISEIIIKCSEFKKIIINLSNPYILYRILKYCKDSNKMFSLGNTSIRNLIRFIILGFNVNTKFLFLKSSALSVREEIKNILNFKLFDDLFTYNKEAEVNFNDIKIINYNWSIPHDCISHEDSSNCLKVRRFEMLSLYLLLDNLHFKDHTNHNYLYLLILKNIFKIKDFYTRLRFFRDTAKIDNLNHNKFFEILKTNFDDENSSAFKFEFLISCLFASKNPKLSEKSLLSIKSLLSSTNFETYKVNGNESKFGVLNEIINLASQNKINEINDYIVKHQKNIENIGFVLICLPSILSNDQLEKLFSDNELIFGISYFHYFFRGLLYANDLDEFEISVFCINNKFEKSLYSNLYETLLNDKVLDAIFPVNSNIIYILFKNISFKKDLTQTSFPAKLAVARLFMLSNDNESAFEIISTIDFSQIDRVESISLLSFFKIWDRLGVTFKDIYLPNKIEELPYEISILFWDLYFYSKESGYSFEFDIKRINEENNQFSFHLFITNNSFAPNTVQD